MDNPTTERTPLVIAAEINMITCQTKKIVLASAIE
ncbi:preprotein translocase subunit SecA, partial [Dehalobacter sp. 12DCB1]